MSNRKKRFKNIRLSPLIILTVSLFILLIILFSAAFTSKKDSGKSKSGKSKEVETTESGETASGDQIPVIKLKDNSDPVPMTADDAEAYVEQEEADEALQADGTELHEGSAIPQANEEGILRDEFDEQADSILSRMTLEEKIYQMMILMPEQLTGSETVTSAGNSTKESLKRYPVGGIMYMAGNLKDPGQTRAMLENTQEYAADIEGIPLFLCVDEEGGRVARIGNNNAFGTEKISPMAKTGSAEEARSSGRTIGEYLKELGFNVNFAPDCDVLTNKTNKVIGDRSFGSDADKVREYARAYSDGLHDSGIVSVYKHFPGHGATSGDTHEGFAYTDKTIDELKEAELVPFADAAEAGADMVMVSHISVPRILGDNTPCSLSYHMVTEVLKDELGYDGIVVTDALNMGAISDNYNGTDAAVMAIKAGNDMLLTPGNFTSIPKRIASEIENGNISEARIDESVRKIITGKLKIKEADDQ